MVENVAEPHEKIESLGSSFDRVLLRCYWLGMAAWTTWGVIFVVNDHGWGAVSVGGQGNVIVNGAIALMGLVYSLARSVATQRFRGGELIAAILIPAASSVLIVGAFAAAHLR